MAEWDVVVGVMAAISFTLELRATLSYSSVHVLLSEVREKILSAFVDLGGGFCIHLSVDT